MQTEEEKNEGSQKQGTMRPWMEVLEKSCSKGEVGVQCEEKHLRMNRRMVMRRKSVAFCPYLGSIEDSGQT